ncbi:hypothetical protein [Jeotgalibacillus sp. R-1-5s-1]|uniref:hypothetical protein n=1 Tax=Jeotgalibacillus sp. R-1-5s-1 TaxID=2555897 RepID=UPI00106B5D3E|nr:hypothetical protein [Jeotgalibacillus sp. R-1-5s-1]TFD94322.1 hypothetical protein E2491_12815 [Jeotgalibacillus sp. R-1-5s-1]
MGELESIDALDNYVQELGNEIKNVKKASNYLKDIENQQILLKQQLEGVKETTITLEKIQSNFEEKTIELEQQLIKNNDRFKELNSTVATSFQGTADYLKIELESLKSNNATVNNEVKELQSRSSLLEQQIVSMSAAVSTANNSIVDLQRKIDHLDTSSQSLKSSLQSNHELQMQQLKLNRNLSILMPVIVVAVLVIVQFL